MAVQSLMDASHTEVLSEFEDIITILESDAFAPSRRMLEAEGLPPTFAADMRTVVKRYGQERVEQVGFDRTHRAESSAARAAAEKGRNWLRYTQRRSKLLTVRKDPAAPDIAIRLSDLDLGSTLSTRAALEEVLYFIETSPDAARLGLSESQIAEGKGFLAAIPAEHADAVEARVSREYETQSMREDNELLGQQLEELMLLVELVELRYGIILPGLELALLRSAAARISRKTEEPAGESGGGSGDASGGGAGGEAGGGSGGTGFE